MLSSKVDEAKVERHHNRGSEVLLSYSKVSLLKLPLLSSLTLNEGYWSYCKCKYQKRYNNVSVMSISSASLYLSVTLHRLVTELLE